MHNYYVICNKTAQQNPVGVVIARRRSRRSPDANGVRANKDSFNRPFLRKGRSNLKI